MGITINTTKAFLLLFLQHVKKNTWSAIPHIKERLNSTAFNLSGVKCFWSIDIANVLFNLEILQAFSFTRILKSGVCLLTNIKNEIKLHVMSMMIIEFKICKWSILSSKIDKDISRSKENYNLMQKPIKLAVKIYN